MMMMSERPYRPCGMSDASRRANSFQRRRKPRAAGVEAFVLH